MDLQRHSGRRATSPPRRQRACAPCSKAKARCNFQPGNVEVHVCDRCEKIGIDCTKKTTQSLRKPRQIRPLNSRVLNLERQVQHLASSLEDSPTRQRTASVSSAQSDYVESPSSTGTPASMRHGAYPSMPRPMSLPQSLHTMTAGMPPNGLTWREASAVLSIYRRKFMIQFPCVLIDSTVSAQQLLEEKPFLFRSIMLTAAPLPVSRAKKMKRNVMAYLGHRMLVDEQRQLELLQGLLVLLTWNDMDYNHDSQVTLLTYTALGLAHSLRLTKTPLITLQRLGRSTVLDDALQLDDNIPDNGHTAEELRAFVGLYCVVSLDSTNLGRRNPLDAQFLLMCCDSLAASHDSPEDYFLERMARMYLIADKITSMFGSPNDAGRSQPFLFLVEGHARGIRTELSTLMESLTFKNLQIYQQSLPRYRHIDENEYKSRRDFFTLYYHYLLVRLYEPAISLQNAPLGEPSRFRSACLRNCLLATKAYLDAFLSIPPLVVVYTSTIAREPLSLVVAIAARLMFLEAPEWDTQTARSTLDMCRSLDMLIEVTISGEIFRRQLAASFAKEFSGVDEALSNPDGTGDDESISCVHVERLRAVKTRYEAKIMNEAGTPWLDPAMTVSLGNWDAMHDQLPTTHAAPLPGKGISPAVTEVVGTGATSMPYQGSVPVGISDATMGSMGQSFYGGIYGAVTWEFGN